MTEPAITTTRSRADMTPHRLALALDALRRRRERKAAKSALRRIVARYPVRP